MLRYQRLLLVSVDYMRGVIVIGCILSEQKSRKILHLEITNLWCKRKHSWIILSFILKAFNKPALNLVILEHTLRKLHLIQNSILCRLQSITSLQAILKHAYTHVKVVLPKFKSHACPQSRIKHHQHSVRIGKLSHFVPILPFLFVRMRIYVIF